MKTLTLYIVVCFPALLLAKPRGLDEKDLLQRYATAHPNDGEDEPECEILNEPEHSETSPLNAIVDRNRLWTNRILFYEITGPTFDETKRAQIKAALYDLHVNTSVDGNPCVTFIESDSEENRVTLKDCGGSRCSSSVGMMGGSQRMCLSPRCFKAHGTLIHEFLHALGFYHEHSRADRDENVYINFDNIIKGKERNFAKRTLGVDIDHLKTSYDYSSVMHYKAYHFAVDPTIPTIVPLETGVTIGQRVALSDLDIERVQILYGCKDPIDSVYFKQLAGKL